MTEGRGDTSWNWPLEGRNASMTGECKTGSVSHLDTQQEVACGVLSPGSSVLYQATAIPSPLRHTGKFLKANQSE